MSQISPKPTPKPTPPSLHPPNDGHRGGGAYQEPSKSLDSPRPSRRVLDNLPNFSYDIDEQSKDPLDSWPREVEMRPRRTRSTLLSSFIRGNQPHRSFFGDNVNDDDNESEGTARVKRRASNPLNDARRLSKTAVSALKEKVPAVPWRPKRSLSQSANSRARACLVSPPRSFLPSSLLINVMISHISLRQPEEIHPPACQSVPHVRRALASRRDAALRSCQKASHPRVVRVYTGHHHGLLQRRGDAHDRVALCALQRAHRPLGPR